MWKQNREKVEAALMDSISNTLETNDKTKRDTDTNRSGSQIIKQHKSLALDLFESTSHDMIPPTFVILQVASRVEP